MVVNLLLLVANIFSHIPPFLLALKSTGSSNHRYKHLRLFKDSYTYDLYMALQHGSITSSVIEDLTKRLVCKVLKKFKRQTAAEEKLQRLDMLLIQINSAIEVSQRCCIQSTWLRQWLEKLKQGASQGDEILVSFRQHAIDEADWNTRHQVQSTSRRHTFSRTALLGKARSIRNATKVLFSSNEGVGKLHSTLERLEHLSAGAGMFIRLVDRELWAEKEKRQTKKPRLECASCSANLMDIEKQDPTECLVDTYWEDLRRKLQRDTTLVVSDDGITYKGRYKELAQVSNTVEIARLEETLCTNKESMQVLEEWFRAVPFKPGETIERAHSSSMLLYAACGNENSVMNRDMFARRLGIALYKIGKAVEMADSRDLGCLRWLAQWAGILKVTMQEGNAVLATINTYGLPYNHEGDEFGRFLHSVERLANDTLYFGDTFVLAVQIPNFQVKSAHQMECGNHLY